MSTPPRTPPRTLRQQGKVGESGQPLDRSPPPAPTKGRVGKERGGKKEKKVVIPKLRPSSFSTPPRSSTPRRSPKGPSRVRTAVERIVLRSNGDWVVVWKKGRMSPIFFGEVARALTF